ncbi:MAG: nuclear transport factor 2 family protein, partial [Acidimicrobiia bacterium]|nr:nuclear transport factor 2 family protein [Acidimicrobiia bacterium]
MERAEIEAWVAAYERGWRTPGTRPLGDLFTDDITYLPSPWATPVVGLADLAIWWDAERDGPEEVFATTSEVVAVDEDVAVVRVSVDYEEPSAGRWRDLWVLHFAGNGRCKNFEEWPFSPEQPDGH